MKTAVIIPCYKTKKFILPIVHNVLSMKEVWRLYIVDDCCPEKTGEYVKENIQDTKLMILFNNENLGVGGATLTGWQQACVDGAEILIKIDGDGQMDICYIPKIVNLIQKHKYDYVKGQRFWNLESFVDMPRKRAFGNMALSFITKISSGYYNIFDPTNGYIAINAKVFEILPSKKISKSFFFESDMLFHLNIIRAVIKEVPMIAIYGKEKSNLKISKILFDFPYLHIVNFVKRIVFNYYLRGMSVGSISLPLGLTFFVFGITFGCFFWIRSLCIGEIATSGTVMVSALTIICGIQFILLFFVEDFGNVPKTSLISEDFEIK
ncbi:MAG: glycosyltransferase family 2 protein [Endomicrobium sp.]|nr:glycosyltransferase family 2 protein [Endomicrobium sp.]